MNNLAERYKMLSPHLTEKTRRLYAASECIGGGRGIKGEVSRATGVSYREIRRGLAELQGKTLDVKEMSGRIRKTGGGRKQAKESNPGLIKDIQALVEPSTLGDPCAPLLYTSKSLRQIAGALREKGYKISHVTVGELLKDMGYTLQANSKTLAGKEHPDRNAQFEYINEKVLAFQTENQPVISVDCKKHELIGNYKNNGREYHPKETPVTVKDHDFMDKELGKAIPYGVYDISKNEGLVNVGNDHDTSVFAVESIRTWWFRMGKERYENATKLLITADGGGSNGYRRRAWKTELAKLVQETGLQISVCHFPTGTSKWNKIEHRLFSHITMNWRGKPLVTMDVIVSLIANTTTAKGLKVECVSDERVYPKGIKISDDELNSVNIVRDEFHGDWNYSILS